MQRDGYALPSTILDDMMDYEGAPPAESPPRRPMPKLTPKHQQRPARSRSPRADEPAEAPKPGEFPKLPSRSDRLRDKTSGQISLSDDDELNVDVMAVDADASNDAALADEDPNYDPDEAVPPPPMPHDPESGNGGLELAGPIPEEVE